MKRIVNGRKYDTTTARKVCEWTPTDWANEDAGIYRKRTGEYFEAYWHNLYGEHITPLTREDARAICEAHMGVDEYEAEFGEVEE